MILAFNIAAFQVGWFACVLAAAFGAPWVGIVTAAVVVAVHVLRVPRDTRLIAAAILLGALFDSMLAAAGWVAFKPAAPAENLAPYWILALWALFATTLNVSLGWLRQRLALASVLGMIAGPLAYWAGSRLGALELVQPTVAILALALGWGIVLPGLLALARHWEARPA